ncbi:MAG: hydrolase [Bacteroidota bacterium]|nr:MAG: beta-lactamase domain-containing protein [Bacteroidetes bacterium OLB12]GIL23162.1 MAG: hydrolase [Bacteroidota bacterium]
MKITFLGTGTSQGVPVIGCGCEVCQSLDYRDKRLRSSIHLQVNELSLVIDTGPDFRQQMLREHIHKLDAVLFTHSHKDHIAGLDDVRAYNYLQKKDMPVYGNADVLAQLKTEFYYAFEKNKYPGIPQLKLHELNHELFSIGSVKIQPLPVLHYQLPVLGFRIHNFSYITDANQIPASTLDLLKGTETLVLNALQREKHLSHFNLEEALAMAERIGAKQTYFIHISHKLGCHKIVERELPNSVALAYDGLTIEA